jgi:hypothetical protein
VVALRAPVETVPPVACVPLQPAEAVHAAAFVVLQISVEALPVATLVGLAVKFSVGAGNTLTGAVADADGAPAAPAQVNV